jgi:hypothetical protein
VTKPRVPSRARSVATVFLAALSGAVLAVAVLAPTARADTTTADNPWAYQMTDPGNGMVITGDAGPQNNNAFLVKDYLNQPIFSVSEAGGAAVMGDNFRVLAGDDIYNAVVTVSPSAPPASCPKAGALWVGAGNVWKCVGGRWAPPRTSLW